MEPSRITRFDGSVMADALFLIGHAWIKRVIGDEAGAAEDEAAVARLLPPDTIAAIRNLIIEGDLPAPGPDPVAMDAWLEKCRQAGAGEWRLLRITVPSAEEERLEQEKAFLARLAEIRAESEAARGIAPAAPEPAKPLSLADELRKMGLM
jgi:hypothetical protein